MSKQIYFLKMPFRFSGLINASFYSEINYTITAVEYIFTSFISTGTDSYNSSDDAMCIDIITMANYFEPPNFNQYRCVSTQPNKILCAHLMLLYAWLY